MHNYYFWSLICRCRKILNELADTSPAITVAKIEEEESSSQDDVEVGEAAQNLSTNTVGMHDAGIIHSVVRSPTHVITHNH